MTRDFLLLTKYCVTQQKHYGSHYGLRTMYYVTT